MLKIKHLVSVRVKTYTNMSISKFGLTKSPALTFLGNSLGKKNCCPRRRLLIASSGVIDKKSWKKLENLHSKNNTIKFKYIYQTLATFTCYSRSNKDKNRIYKISMERIKEVRKNYMLFQCSLCTRKTLGNRIYINFMNVDRIMQWWEDNRQTMMQRVIEGW